MILFLPPTSYVCLFSLFVRENKRLNISISVSYDDHNSNLSNMSTNFHHYHKDGKLKTDSNSGIGIQSSLGAEFMLFNGFLLRKI